MKQLICHFILVLVFASPAMAVMVDNFTASGVVKSFDQKNVTVLCQERLVQIPRESITEGKLEPGQSVKFALTGEQVSKIFFSQSPKQKK